MKIFKKAPSSTFKIKTRKRIHVVDGYMIIPVTTTRYYTGGKLVAIQHNEDLTIVSGRRPLHASTY